MHAVNRRLYGAKGLTDIALVINSQGQSDWHPKVATRLGLFRYIQMPGGREVLFSNPAGLAEKIIITGRE